MTPVIQKPTDGATSEHKPMATVEITSPAAATLEKAEAEMTSIKRPTRKPKASRSQNVRRKRSSTLSTDIFTKKSKSSK
jgi:hypothetical protein